MLKRLLCQIFDHRVNRNRVWNDQIDFRTNCARCGAPLLRDARGWREFDGERDASVHRESHPRNRQLGD